MRYEFRAEASSQIREVSDGAWQLEHDGSGVYLVHVGKSARIQILQSIAATDVADERFKLIASLSDREQQVFAMLGEGLDMAQIGERMRLSVKTIETYRARIKQKLNIDNRMQLLALAVEWSLDERAKGVTPSPNGQPKAALTASSSLPR